ncbi:MAG: L-fucose isomerase [Spirochaetales bacterium]|nr:L-fucose isomerase [Spirochaetales bacterium]
MSEYKGYWKPALPKIGIRPTIDGRRRGVRESLEAQIMGQAKAAAKFLTENLRHPSGEPVECVIADSCIGGVVEAAQCREKFRKEGVGVSLTVTTCWCYGSETMDMDPVMPKAVWGFNGTQRPGAVYLAAVLAAHAQKGLPAFGIYGKDVQDPDDMSIPEDVGEKLLQFARAGLAVATMQGRSYLAIGGTSMGIAGSIVDNSLFQNYLGMRNEMVDSTELIRRMDEGIYDQDEYKKALEWTKRNCPEGRETNPPAGQKSKEAKAKDWEFVVKMALIARDLMIGNPKLAKMGYEEEAMGRNALVGGFQGQRQWTDFYPNGDFMESILTTSFDWNGIRQPFMFATENDSLNGVSMLLGHLINGAAQIFADVRTFWSPDAVKRVTGHKLDGQAKDGIIHLINSGAAALDGAGRMKDKKGNPVMKPFWEITDKDVEASLKATTWGPAVTEYFRGGGYSSTYSTEGVMPVTMIRLNLIDGLGPALQIAEGWTVDLPEKVRVTLEERTNPTWPSTWFAPRLTGQGPFKDVYSVMNAWGANHGSFSYGHYGKDIITLASMLRIPVYMHNVDADKVYRPAAWNAFGTADFESADFRACAAYGPLYGLKK